MNAHTWTLNIVPDCFDSAQTLISVIDDSEASRSHPQGPLVLAQINARAFAPHIEHAEKIGALMAAAPALRSALIGILNRYGDTNPATFCDASRAAQQALALVDSLQAQALEEAMQ